MTSATLERPSEAVRGTGRGRTLEDVVAGAWERLSAGAAVACPVCEGDLRPGPHATGTGACASCGTTLR